MESLEFTILNHKRQKMDGVDIQQRMLFWSKLFSSQYYRLRREDFRRKYPFFLNIAFHMKSLGLFSLIYRLEPFVVPISVKSAGICFDSVVLLLTHQSFFLLLFFLLSIYIFSEIIVLIIFTEAQIIWSQLFSFQGGLVFTAYQVSFSDFSFLPYCLFNHLILSVYLNPCQRTYSVLHAVL